MYQWNKNYDSINLQLGNYNLCYKKLAIFSCNRRYYFVSGSQDFSNEEHHIFYISKDTNPERLELNEDKVEIPIQGKNRKDEILNFLKEFYHTTSITFELKSQGLMGFIRFTAGYYAVLIEDTEVVGNIMEHQILEIKKAKLFMLFDKGKISEIPKEHRNRENKNREAIKKYLSNEKLDFYFSYTYDMSKNLQDNFTFSLGEQQRNREFYEEKDMPHFQWNYFLKKNFSEASKKNVESEKWVVKVVHGSFDQMNIQLYSNMLSVCLIARRLVQNAGTRYNKRGLNEDGFPANYVEVEQLVVNNTLYSNTKPLVSSFVQIRASIPYYWYQENSLKSFQPEIKVNAAVDPNYLGPNKHFNDLITLYGKNIYCLNLIKSRAYMKKNREEELGIIFPEIVKKLREKYPLYEGIVYNHIDLKNSMKEDRDNFFEMAILMSEDLADQYGSFFLDGFSEEAKIGNYTDMIKVGYQRGIVRTNCVDCLDRTNLMQNLISERAFYKQLRICLRISENEEVDVNDRVMVEFQEMWKSLGDIISLQYGGSKAHRQKGGRSVTKIVTSVKRHVSNTFADNARQFNMSLFLGEIDPNTPYEAFLERSIKDRMHKPSENLICKFDAGDLGGQGFKRYISKLSMERCIVLNESTFLVKYRDLVDWSVPKKFIHVLLNYGSSKLRIRFRKNNSIPVIIGHDEEEPKIKSVKVAEKGENYELDSSLTNNRFLIEQKLENINSFIEVEKFYKYLESAFDFNNSSKKIKATEYFNNEKRDIIEDDDQGFLCKDQTCVGLIDSDLMKISEGKIDELYETNEKIEPPQKKDTTGFRRSSNEKKMMSNMLQLELKMIKSILPNNIKSNITVI